jgi:hypothetical protein
MPQIMRAPKVKMDEVAPGLKGAETRMRPVTCWFVWGDSSVR